MRPKEALSLLKEAASRWSDDRASSMGAAISYYSMFSIAPLLVIVIAVAGLFFGADAVQGAILAQLSDLMGPDAAKAVGEMLQHANQPKTGALAAAVSTAVLLLGASTVFSELQAALDSIWRVPELAKESGLWKFIRSRLLTFGMVLAMAFLMTVSLLMSAALSTLAKWWGPFFGSWELLAHAFDLAVSFGLLTLVFGMIYKFMPRAHIRWHDVWIGAAVTALLFTIGKFLIGLYIGKSSIASSFGVFGSLALLMVWVYYSAQIFLYGAEFTWVYANKFGSRRAEKAEERKPASAPSIAPIPPISPIPVPLARGKPASAMARHLPEIAVTGALLLGALLGKAAPRGWRSLRAKL
jgi:membrane protein